MAAVAQTGSAIERYVVPRSLEEAARVAAEGPTTLLAGGTDLMPQSQGGMGLRPTLMNVRRLGERAGIERSEGRIRLGATATVTEVLESALLAATAPVLVRAADCFGSDQVRNAATIGGNVCNASPAGDMIVPLLLLDAVAELASWADGALQRRHLPLNEIFEGPGATRLAPGEILVCLRFAVPGEGFRAGFAKFGPRPALEVALAAVGVAGKLESGALVGARAAFGAVAPTPMRGPETEAALEGRPLDDETIAAAAETAAREVRPIDDVRGSAWYRRGLVRTLTGRLLADVVRD